MSVRVAHRSRSSAAPFTRSLALGLLLVVGAVGVTQSASASPVEDKREEAQRIAAQIEALNNQSFDLGEEYDRVETELAEVDAEVAVAQKRVAELEAQVSSMRTAMQGFAVQSYIYGVQGDGVAAILGGTDAPAVAAQREQYTELVLGSSVSKIDELETVSQDAAEERQNLEAKQAKKRTLQKALSDKKAEVDASIQKAGALQSKVKGELATLVVQEQARRAQQAAARSRTSSGSNSSSGGGGGRTISSQSSGRSSAPSGPRAGANVPAPSPGAAGAVAAAMSQLGVGYRYATASPGRGVRLLRAHVVGVGPGRPRPAAELAVAVRGAAARGAGRHPAGRPRLLLQPHQPRRPLHRQRADGARHAPR